MNLNLAFHAKTVEDGYGLLETSEKGLSEAQVKRRYEQFGKNRLEEQARKSVWQILLSQVNNPVIYLLTAAVVVSFIFSDIPEAIAIIVVILLNTIIGFWMEYRAQTSIEALKKLDPLRCMVTRNGHTQEIKAIKLVPGDIIHLESGDLVPADARIASATELSVDESPLTGESVPVSKSTDPVEEDTQVADRSCILFKGTSISTGKATAIVTATGMGTELGNISQMVSESTKEEIPLNKKLGKLAHRLIWGISGLSALFFLIGWLADKEIYLLLQTAIAWTVAAIPEGLPIVASISLARGMLRLGRQNVLVRRLSAVETLGETTVILTDKTGTLTKNRLTLDTVKLVGGGFSANNDGEIEESEAFEHFFRIAVLCNDAEKEEEDTFVGDPLDAALLEFTCEHNLKKHNDLRQLQLINEDPFDSEDMFMGTIHTMDNGPYLAAKGSTEVILERCKEYFDSGKCRKIDQHFKDKWKEKATQLSAEGLKVIAYAFRQASPDDEGPLKDKDDFVEDMVFVGISGFIDPVREDIAESVEQFQHSGIRVVMVTGDHPETAVNIARKVHIVYEDDDVHPVHGNDLDNTDHLAKHAVFARVDPSQKLQIVEAFQQSGEIVGMTGDGVNDAPALKKAEIGIAMGKRGTQVAREVSEMVLKDDAFPSILNAIRQGRVIFDNIKIFIIYQLSYHLAEIVIIAAISFTMFQLPLLPLQLLFLNLLSDVFPALALGIGQGNVNIMERPPKDPDVPIMTKKDWMVTVIYGIVISIFMIGAYLFGFFVMDWSAEMCNSITFFAVAFGQFLHVFNMREADEPVFKNQVTRNKYIWMALALCTTVLMAAYFIPSIGDILSFEKFDKIGWIVVGVSAVLALITNQTIKKIWNL
jgi:Ca2+-transporting ATPase